MSDRQTDRQTVTERKAEKRREVKRYDEHRDCGPTFVGHERGGPASARRRRPLIDLSKSEG